MFMAGIEIGTICVKTKGREAGRKAAIVDFDGKSKFALIDGPKVKRRKCNLSHLFPTGKKISIKKNASHDEVVKHMK